jgi:ABC-type transport system involved in multi-copper enzyme maturation permease subunit
LSSRLPSWEFPFIKREFVGLLRTRPAFWLLVSTVIVSSTVTLLAWPSRESMLVSAGMRNRGVFIAFFLTQLDAVLLVIPAITSTAISGERERGTYEAFYSTLLSPAGIIFAKILAPVGYVIVVLLSCAPAVCVLYLLGGMSFGAFLRCYAVTLAAVVSAGFVCLSASMRSRRNAHAVVRGILWVLFWNVGLLFLAQLVGMLLFGSRGPQPGSTEMAVLMAVGPCLSPLVPVMFEVAALPPGVAFTVA